MGIRENTARTGRPFDLDGGMYTSTDVYKDTGKLIKFK